MDGSLLILTIYTLLLYIKSMVIFGVASLINKTNNNITDIMEEYKVKTVKDISISNIIHSAR